MKGGKEGEKAHHLGRRVSKHTVESDRKNVRGQGERERKGRDASRDGERVGERKKVTKGESRHAWESSVLSRVVLNLAVSTWLTHTGERKSRVQAPLSSRRPILEF